MLNKPIIIILGMMIVTFIPRLIPFFTIHGKELPCKVKRFLEYVPYAALGALIIPAAFDGIPGHLPATFVGLAFAIIYSYIKGGIIVTVVGAMGVAFLVINIGG